MFLSDLSIKQPVLATMMMAALAVLGLTSYQALKVDLFPDVEFPVVTVTTRHTGASPETVERDVTKFIEEAVNTVEGVRHTESTSQEALSNIAVQFNAGVPTLNASQDIRGKVAAIRGELPREIDEPIILRIDPASTPIVSVAVNAPTLTPRAVSDIADKVVKRRLENVTGGGREHRRRESAKLGIADSSRLGRRCCAGGVVDASGCRTSMRRRHRRSRCNGSDGARRARGTSARRSARSRERVASGRFRTRRSASGRRCRRADERRDRQRAICDSADVQKQPVRIRRVATGCGGCRAMQPEPPPALCRWSRRLDVHRESMGDGSTLIGGL